jgi:uncharacterized protein (DUF58 family)
VRAGRFRIHITRVGWLFLLLCLGIGAAALNTGNNLLYLIFGMMCSFLILSGILSNNTLNRVVIVPHFPARIFATDLLPVHIDLVNLKRRFPSFALLLSPASKDVEAPDKAFVLKLHKGERVSVANHIRFPKRGRSKLPDYEVETDYPFGLIRKAITIPSEGDAVVYPAIVPIESWIALDHRAHGDFLSNWKGESSNPYGLRKYVYGDHIRFVHWKTSAKLGRWMVKEFEREKRMKVSLDVRLARTSESQPVFLEKALSAAASLLLSLAARGFEMSLTLNGQPVETRGAVYLDTYLTALALAEPPSDNSPRISGTRLSAESSVLVSDLPASRFQEPTLLTIAREQLEAL